MLPVFSFYCITRFSVCVPTGEVAVIGASLSEPHIYDMAVRELYLYDGGSYICPLIIICTEAACNILHWKVCVLKTSVCNVH